MTRSADRMHRFDEAAAGIAGQILAYVEARLRMDPPPLDGPRTEAELAAPVTSGGAGTTITRAGLGADEALRRFVEVLAPACISVDHPRYLSFVPAAPTEASVLFDLVVGASSIYGGSWMEASGAVFAENAALRWIADLAGLPESAGGVFVSGGTAGNLSALVAAREGWRGRREGGQSPAGGPSGAASDPARPIVVSGAGAHSSVVAAARVMDVDVVEVAGDAHGRVTGTALGDTLGRLDADGSADRVFAVVATAGTTNLGIVDDLAGVATVCAERAIWLHVDAAYGGAAMAAPSVRDRFVGVEHADSLVVDPHKWLFAPYDCCALLYRDPQPARRAHTQHAAYLDVFTGREEWNPSEFAHHLSRRARGLPFWFSLASWGTDAYAEAVEATLQTARAAAKLIEADPRTELVTPQELSVVVFRRTGWGPEDYAQWSERLLADGIGFVVPTVVAGETVLRLCFVNPRTTTDDVEMLLDTLGG